LAPLFSLLLHHTPTSSHRYPTPHRSYLYHDTPTTERAPLSLHDALPICDRADFGATYARLDRQGVPARGAWMDLPGAEGAVRVRSEGHTSEVQSLTNLVCRLLLEEQHTLQAPALLVGCTGTRCAHVRTAP